MKAAILAESKQPLIVDDITLPDNLEFGQVLVDVHYSGICGAQINEIDAVKGPDRFLPHLLGHEGSGIVEEIGPGVTNVKPGDHVVLAWRSSCGLCEMCQYGWPVLCDRGPEVDGELKVTNTGTRVNQMANLGTFGTYTVVPESAAVPIDKEIPFEQAALVGCGVATGVGSAINTAKVRAGSTVAVFGCGGVGLNCIQGANIAGATTIIAVDLLNDKLEMAKQFGATHVINASKENPVEIIREFTNGEGVHYAFEAIGVAALPMVQSVECTRKRGITVWVGAPPSNMPVTLDARDLVLEKSIIGSYYGSSQPHLDFSRILRLYKKGKLQLDQLISKTYPLEKINDAFEALSKGEVARSVIIFD